MASGVLEAWREAGWLLRMLLRWTQLGGGLLLLDVWNSILSPLTYTPGCVWWHCWVLMYMCTVDRVLCMEYSVGIARNPKTGVEIAVKLQ